jgi:hypothetical protein
MTATSPTSAYRTPMQWDTSPNAGFTRGTPWESLQPDWATTNVSGTGKGPASLLALHRALISLRASNAALAGGGFAPLSAVTVDDAYLRRDGTARFWWSRILQHDRRFGRCAVFRGRRAGPGTYSAAACSGGPERRSSLARTADHVVRPVRQPAAAGRPAVRAVKGSSEGRRSERIGVRLEYIVLSLTQHSYPL